MKKTMILAAAVGIVFLIVSAFGAFYFAPKLKGEMESLLSDRTGRLVRIESFDWAFWPVLQFKGRGLSIGSSENREGLFVYVEKLTVKAGFRGLLASPRKIEMIELDESLIRIPPRRRPTDVSLKPAALVSQDLHSPTSPVILERLVLTTSAVEILPREIQKPSRIIRIQKFAMDGVALGKSSPFEASLLYPHPKGDVLVQGEFGPFDRNEPIQTPISGNYLFEKADLSTFREIGGILTSDGRFEGDLGENHIEGQAQIPDFQLTKAENIVPMDVKFVVDRNAGEVYLREVDTEFLQTRLTVTGQIVAPPTGAGRVVELKVAGEQARVEDLLRIALKGERPPLIGPIQLNTSVTVPPGPGRVLQRMIVTGDFLIKEGEFTDKGFQEKLAQISRLGRSDQSQSEDDRTFSNLNGEFLLEKGIINFSELNFGVPGLLVSLSGNYELESEQMDFEGRVEMERSVSEMTSGRLSRWLRIVDPLLRRGDAGTSVPIRIKGNRNRPSVSLDF